MCLDKMHETYHETLEFLDENKGLITLIGTTISSVLLIININTTHANNIEVDYDKKDIIDELNFEGKITSQKVKYIIDNNLVGAYGMTELINDKSGGFKIYINEKNINISSESLKISYETLFDSVIINEIASANMHKYFTDIGLSGKDGYIKFSEAFSDLRSMQLIFSKIDKLIFNYSEDIKHNIIDNIILYYIVNEGIYNSKYEGYSLSKNISEKNIKLLLNENNLTINENISNILNNIYKIKSKEGDISADDFYFLEDLYYKISFHLGGIEESINNTKFSYNNSIIYTDIPKYIVHKVI